MRIKLILKVVVTFFCFSCVSVTSFSKTLYEACIPSDWDGYLSFNVKACLLKQLDSLALETASKYPRMKSTDIDRQVERCVSKEPSLDGELKWLSDFDCKVDAYEQVGSSSLTSLEVTGDATKAKELLANIAGVYKHYADIEFVNPSPPSRVEEILEVVPISNIAAYVKIRTWFTNGHRCKYQGIFEYKASDELIAVSKPYSRDNICVLKMTVDAEKIRFFDESPVPYTCQSYCGSRGQLTATDFSNKSKRRIRYLPRLKNSDEYLEAVRDYKVQFKRD